MKNANIDRPLDEDEWNNYILKASFLLEHNYIDGDIFEIAKKLYMKEKTNESEECKVDRP